jgi:hypothetical protein
VTPRAGLRAAMLAVALVAFAAAVAGIGARASYGAQVTADEPHYLMTAISLWEDGDLDVRDEFAAQRYRDFHEIDLAPQARPLADGRLVEPHDPLLPLLLAAPMALGGWVAAKLALCLVAAALAALTLWIAVRRFAVPPVPATVTVGVLGASAPLAAYGSQVYPEIVAALFTAIGVAALTGRLGRAGLATVATVAVALPWLSVKYAPVAVALLAVAAWRLWRDGRRGGVAAVALAGAAGALAFVGLHHLLYDGATPYAAGSHFVDGQLTVVGSDPDYLGRGRRLVGLMVDRGFGIAAWQPAWLLMVPALACLAARRPRGSAALALPLAAGWFTATFVALTMQGWWFPGRQVVVVLPLVALAVAWWARGGGARLWAVAGLGAAGVLAQAWVAVEASTGRLAWVVDLQDTANPLHRSWSALLPDYLRVTAATWTLHWLWAAVALAVAVAAYRRERGLTAPRGAHALA